MPHDHHTPDPKKQWSTFREQASEVLGEEFWQDIAELLPNPGPRIDIYCTATQVVVLAELPGLKQPDQISVRLDGQRLVLEGELPRTYPATDKQITQKERFFGSFLRSLPMPRPVTADGIRAKYDHGLLIVELRIDGHVQPAPIPIEF